jgi:hypothetical protein
MEDSTMGVAERIYELVQSLPEHRAAEVLDFAEHVKARIAVVSHASRAIDFSVFDQVTAKYDGQFDRDALYDRACLR